MSCFVVDRSTMTRAVKAILFHAYGKVHITRFAHIWTEDARAGRDIGRALFALNVKAVKAAHPSDPDMWTCAEPEVFDFADYRRTEGDELVACYKALCVVIYQCNESATCEDPLFVAAEEVRDVLAKHIVSELPAYRKAPW